MNCPKCGALLEKDANFCVSCGANLVDSGVATFEHSDLTQDEQSEQAMTADPPKAEAKGNQKANMLGLAVGTILIIIGLIQVVSAGTSLSSTSFGGDFYTYTYQGIVAISEILASIERAIGWLIVAVGAAIDVIAMKN